MKKRRQLINRLPLQTLSLLATSCEPWSWSQHKWQGNKRCYKILLRPQLSSIQSSQELIEKYRGKKQTRGTQDNSRKKCCSDTHWGRMINYCNPQMFCSLPQYNQKVHKSAGGTTDIEHKMIIIINNCW